VEPLDIVQKVMVPTLTDVGQQFQDFLIFLPELMMAGEAAERVTRLVEQATANAGKASTSLGTVVIGQVEGDVHDIGRNIVRTLLASHGFKVIDLGRDVTASAFLDAAQKAKADVIGLSALMTTTLPAQKRTIRLFEEVGVRSHFKIVIGGGAANAKWAAEIGADGYAGDAAGAVELCKSLLGVTV
jgi:methanogenic corrinoid protein MtbC1